MNRKELTQKRHSIILACLRHNPNKSVTQIAQMLGVSRSIIYTILRSNGIGINATKTAQMAQKAAQMEVK